MRVLVTGAHGFIGRWVEWELAARGHAMVPFDHPKSILDEGSLYDSAAECEAVINLAGVLGTAETVRAEPLSVQVNILGAISVFNAAEEYDIPVVQIATGHRGQLNPYAITKACAEDLALSRAQWTGQRIAVVRAFHVYAAGQKAPPPHGVATVRKIVPSFICRALTGMALEINGGGRQLIDLVYAADVAKVLVDAIDGPYGEVLEAGTGVATAVVDCARDVTKFCHSSSPLLYMKMRQGEPEWSRVVAEKPLCEHAWPYRLDETVVHYRQLLTVSA